MGLFGKNYENVSTSEFIVILKKFIDDFKVGKISKINKPYRVNDHLALTMHVNDGLRMDFESKDSIFVIEGDNERVTLTFQNDFFKGGWPTPNKLEIYFIINSVMVSFYSEGNGINFSPNKQVFSVLIHKSRFASI